MPDSSSLQRLTRAGIVSTIAGVVLLVGLVWKIGPGEIWQGCLAVGWGIAAIVALGGLRFATRALAWTVCVEPPHRLPLKDAFAALIAGDALGNMMLGPLVSEPAKIAYVRGRIPVGAAFTSVAIESLVYTLSVALVIGAGVVALLLVVDLPMALREASIVALAVILAAFAAVGVLVWRQPSVAGRLLPFVLRADSPLRSKMDRVRAIEQDLYTFASRRRAVVPVIVCSELAFHALGVVETYYTLWLILPSPPTLLTACIVESVKRLLIVVFKWVPFQVGVGAVGTGIATQLLGMGVAPGVTLDLVVKARMGVWALVATVVLLRHGNGPTQSS